MTKTHTVPTANGLCVAGRESDVAGQKYIFERARKSIDLDFVVSECVDKKIDQAPPPPKN